MAYNQYGGQGYGAPPGYGGYPGSSSNNGYPGAGAPPGMNAPPGLSSMGAPPGMAPPPGMQQANAPSSNRPGAMPQNFQPPANMPNINFNAPVIRLGTGGGGGGGRDGKPGTPVSGGRDDRTPQSAGGGRSGLGMERGGEQGRGNPREALQMLVPPSNEEKLRTVFIYEIPEGVGGDAGIDKILRTCGSLRKWEASASVMDDHKGQKFGFAQFEDPDSLATAVKLLHEEKIEVPVKKQQPKETPEEDESKGEEEIEKTELKVAVDESTLKYIEAHIESQSEDDQEQAKRRANAAREDLQKLVKTMFHPSTGSSNNEDGDVAMGNYDTAAGDVEVVNIGLAQDDELADIPAEMREVVAKEIAAFRERSNQRDLERLRKEEEMEERERRREQRPSRLDSPPPQQNIPSGPRGGAGGVPTGPRGQNGGHHQSRNQQAFVNGGISNTDYSINREDSDTDASDNELQRRHHAKLRDEDEKRYQELERKWTNREKSRQAAIERELERERHDAESLERRKQEQLTRDKEWDDKKEAQRKVHMFYRDHAAWSRKRGMDRGEEEARDEVDRRAEMEEERREQAIHAKARGQADSFLDRQLAQDESVSSRRTSEAPEAKPFKLSLGAAAQKNQASRTTQRRTVAEVEGLLDDEDPSTQQKRTLIPIAPDALSSSTPSTSHLTEEQISSTIRSLASEIPSTKEGLWAWPVKWEHLDEGILKEKIRPFVEKKVVEYLGVQEEMVVETVEEWVRERKGPGGLVEELEGVMDEEAEGLVVKLWRMVIFFTECEGRGLPA